MDDNNQKDVIYGYEVQRFVTFDNNRGFAFGENPNDSEPFGTWQFIEEDGARDYYWGRYFLNADTAIQDYMLRIDDYHTKHDVSEVDAYKYYSTQRPIDIGTFPKTDGGPVRFENFDKREEVEQGQFRAWVYLVYDAPLTEKQIKDYELRAAPDVPENRTMTRERERTAPKPIMKQFADAAKKVERGGDPATNKKYNRDER